MQFIWVDYPDQYEHELETWCDETVRHAIDDESIKAEHDWYTNSSDHTLNKDYFCKIVLDGEIVVALFMLTMHVDETKKHLTKNIIYLDTLIINPTLRNKGYATKIITEFMQHTKLYFFARGKRMVIDFYQIQ